MIRPVASGPLNRYDFPTPVKISGRSAPHAIADGRQRSILSVTRASWPANGSESSSNESLFCRLQLRHVSLIVFSLVGGVALGGLPQPFPVEGFFNSCR
jgi:hypothetical protein